MLRKANVQYKFIILSVLIGFISVSVVSNLLEVKSSVAQSLDLPEPNQILSSGELADLPKLKGISFDANDPLNIRFLVDRAGRDHVDSKETSKLIRYFLAALTIPEKDLWVNLSPYEKNRIIPANLDATDLGKDLLRQDYVLKQLSSSLTHPDSELGKQYWNSMEADKTFNKVWIVPEQAKILTNEKSAIVDELSFDLQTEADYLAQSAEGITGLNSALDKSTETILDELKNRVNTSIHFAELRQLSNCVLLAKWFKNRFHNSFYISYFNKYKTQGIDIEDKKIAEKVWQLYCRSFELGVYDTIQKTSLESQGKKKRFISGGAVVNFNGKVQSSSINTEYINQLMLNKDELSIVDVDIETFLINDKTGFSSALSPAELKDRMATLTKHSSKLFSKLMAKEEKEIRAIGIEPGEFAAKIIWSLMYASGSHQHADMIYNDWYMLFEGVAMPAREKIHELITKVMYFVNEAESTYLVDEFIKKTAQLMAAHKCLQEVYYNQKPSRGLPKVDLKGTVGLDIASGTDFGRLMMSLTPDQNYIAVDKSKWVANYLKEYASLVDNKNVIILEEDVLKLNKPNVNIGLIRVKNAITYVTEFDSKLGEMLAWIEPGGKLVFQHDPGGHRLPIIMLHSQMIKDCILKGWSFTYDSGRRNSDFSWAFYESLTLTKPKSFMDYSVNQESVDAWNDYVKMAVHELAYVDNAIPQISEFVMIKKATINPKQFSSSINTGGIDLRGIIGEDQETTISSSLSGLEIDDFDGLTFAIADHIETIDKKTLNQFVGQEI